MPSEKVYVSKTDGKEFRGKAVKAAMQRDSRRQAFKDGTSHQKPGSMKKHRR